MNNSVVFLQCTLSMLNVELQSVTLNTVNLFLAALLSVGILSYLQSTFVSDRY